MNISVIVPVYNAEKYVRQCLESIQNQEYRDLEVILVDDGSTDRSKEICDDMAGRDKRFRVIHKCNEGLIHARKDGIMAARGEWIAFVDADDWVDKNFLGSLWEYTRGQDVDLVAAGCIREKDGGQEYIYNEIDPCMYRGEELRRLVFPGMLSRGGFFRFGILPYMWNKLFKKTLLIRCYEDIDFKIYDGEDVAVVYPYLLRAKSIVLTNEAGYHYRIHSESITAEKKKNYYENVSRLYLHLDRKFKETDCYNIMLPQLKQYMRMMVWQEDQESFIESQKYLFPFDKVPKGSKIVLYGAGNVGKTYYYQLGKITYCTVAAWVDKHKGGTNIGGTLVKGIESIQGLTYDFIVVAVAGQKLKEMIIEELVQKNVELKKIIV